MRLTAYLAWACAVLAAQPSAAQDSTADAIGFGDSQAQDAVGFGETDGAGLAEPAPAPAPAPAEPPSPWSLAGYLRLQTALRLERSEPSRIAKLRTTVGAELGYRRELSAGTLIRAVAGGRIEYDPAYELRRSYWDEATLDTYELQLIPGDVFVALQVESFELSTGKQIVNLGQGEVLSVLDTVSPRDQREPAAADPEELRLSVFTTRASLSTGSHRAELIVVHEPYFGLAPPPLGELSGLRRTIAEQPAGALLASRELSYRHVPGRSEMGVDSVQAYARMTLVGEGFDLAFLGASLLDPLGVASLPDPAALAEPELELIVHHPRFARFGHSGALPISSFVVRWELAFDAKRPLALVETEGPFERMTSVRRDQVSGLLGVSYVPAPTTSAALELQQSYVLDHPTRGAGGAVEPLLPVEAPQLALRIDHTFLRDRAALQLVLLLIGLDPLNAFVARGVVDYELTPGLRAGVGFICYAPSASERGPFYGLGGTDRAYAQLRWDFAP